MTVAGAPHNPTLHLFKHYYEPAKNHQTQLASDWDDYEKAFLGDTVLTESADVEPSDDWRSRVLFKYAWQQAQTVVAELSADDDPTFIYEPSSPSNADYADTVKAVVDYQLQRDDYPMKRLMATMYAVVYGGAPLKVHWDYRESTYKERQHDGSYVDRVQVVRDQPTITLIDPRDFMWDMRARSMEEARYAFHRTRQTLDELKSYRRADGSPLYKNLEQLEPQAGEVGDETVRAFDNDKSAEREKAHRQGHEIVEMWTRDRLITVANENIVIRDDPNPYRHGRLPFAVARVLPTLNDVWGQSLMWAVRDPQELLWTLDNANIDALKLQLDPPMAVNSNDPDAKQFVFEPGARLPSPDAANAFKLMETAGVDRYTSEQAIREVRERLKFISGVTDEISGASTADTATQAALNQRQSKGRIGIMLRVIDRAFAECAEMIVQLNQQYLDLSVPVRIMGPMGDPVWKPVRPSEIAGMWHVRPRNSSERVVKELYRQNLLELQNSLMPQAGVVNPDGTTVNLGPIAGKIVESFDFHADEIVVDATQMFEQRRREMVADAIATAEAQQHLPPPPEAAPAPQQQEEPLTLQKRILQSMDYDKLGPDAQRAFLAQQGLPTTDVDAEESIQRAQQAADLEKTIAQAEQARAAARAAGQRAFHSAKPSGGDSR